MAFEDSFCSRENAVQAMLLQRLNGIMGATGVKPALSGKMG